MTDEAARGATGGIEEYVAFLRAVNVGGRTMEMARLRETLAGLGLGTPRTYIASGNAFFTAPGGGPEERRELAGRIGAELEKVFGFAVPVVLRTHDQLAAELEAAPFAAMERAEDERFSLIFASGPVTPDDAMPSRSAKGDWEVLGRHGNTLFVRTRLLGGRPGANPVPVIEKAYGVKATGRFFHTTEKILTAARRAA
jgi:uncharacterized protein (DUF1697 family)